MQVPIPDQWWVRPGLALISAVAAWNIGLRLTPLSSIPMLPSLTPASITLRLMACSTSLVVGIGPQTLLLMPTMSEGLISIFQALITSFSPSSVVTASSSIFWMTSGFGFLKETSAFSSLTRTTLAFLPASSCAPLKLKVNAPARGASEATRRKSRLVMTFFAILFSLLNACEIYCTRFLWICSKFYGPIQIALHAEKTSSWLSDSNKTQ